MSVNLQPLEITNGCVMQSSAEFRTDFVKSQKATNEQVAK